MYKVQSLPIEYRAFNAFTSQTIKTHYGPCYTCLFLIKSVSMYFWSGGQIAKVSEKDFRKPG